MVKHSCPTHAKLSWHISRKQDRMTRSKQLIYRILVVHVYIVFNIFPLSLEHSASLLQVGCMPQVARLFFVIAESQHCSLDSSCKPNSYHQAQMNFWSLYTMSGHQRWER